MIWFLGIILFGVLGIALTGWSVSAPGYQGPKSDHFNGTTFQNIGGVDSKNLWQVLKWMINREQGEWVEMTKSDVSYGKPPAKKVEKGLQLTYVNHSTFLIQTAGFNILTDPVWAERVSPFSFMGPRRMRPPGIRFRDLPPIDVVLVSHNHYDHLDIDALQRLKADFDPLFLVPLGVDLYLQKKGISKTISMDWWNEEQVTDTVSVAFVPAQHFSARGMFDRDKTLWGGFVLQSPAANIYFAGDTGYGSFFPEIGKRYAPIKIGLIPIGAYKPRWFMSPVHLDPEEAIQVHHDVEAEVSIGMHYGTFPLADDGQYDPLNDLKKALAQQDSTPDFRILEEGKSLMFN
ncbi:MAG: twin-arginine translocation pathway signal [Balneolaceae bacterium]|nr:twin-arginine translocation pathway signal [Balneolaceae bacterium]